jgi:hypothetical protein
MRHRYTVHKSARRFKNVGCIAFLLLSAFGLTPSASAQQINQQNIVSNQPYNPANANMAILPGGNQTGDEFDFFSKTGSLSCYFNDNGFLNSSCFGGGPSPWVDCTAYGCVGDLYTTNSAYVTVSPSTQVHLTSGHFTTQANIGQYIWTFGGGFNQPSAPGLSLISGGTAPNSSLCVQVDLVAFNASNVRIATGPPSTETCTTPSGTQAIQVTIPASQTLNGVASKAFEVWAGPSRQERLQNPNINALITGASASGGNVVFTISLSGSVNPFFNTQIVTTSGFSASCNQYNLASQVITAVTSTTFTVANAATGGSCASGQTANANAAACASGGSGTLFGPDETGQYYCLISGGANAIFGNFTTQTPIAPQNDGVNPGSTATGWFRSTVATINSDTLVTTADQAPQTSGSSGSPVHAVWFTDNSQAEISALSLCLVANNQTGPNAGGCGIFFPPPGTPIPNRATVSTGWYGSIKAFTINPAVTQNVNLFTFAAGGIQNAGSFANGITVTNDRPATALVTVGSDFAVTVGSPTTLTQGFQATNLGTMDATSSANNFGIGYGGFNLLSLAASKLIDSSGFGFSGGTALIYNGAAAQSSQANEVRGFMGLDDYYCMEGLNLAVDTQIYGGECSGPGAAVATPTSQVPAGSIGFYGGRANTTRVWGTDFQNFGTAGIYCYNCNRFSTKSARFEEVGQSSLANSSAVVLDGNSTTLCTAFDVDDPQIAGGFAHSVTVTTGCGAGTVKGDFPNTALNVLNNSAAQGVLTTVIGSDPQNTPSQVTVPDFNAAFNGTPTPGDALTVGVYGSAGLQVSDSGISFTSAGAGTVLGNNTGAAAAPTFNSSPVLGKSGTTAGSLTLAPNGSATPTTEGQLEHDGSLLLNVLGSNSTTFHEPKIQTVIVAPGANSTYDCLASVTGVTGCGTQATSETAFATSYSIPTGEIIANKTVRIRVFFQTVEATGGTTVTLKARVSTTSGTTICGLAASGTLAGTKSGYMEVDLQGLGAVSGSTNVNMNCSALVNSGILSDQTATPILLATNGAITFQPTASFAAATSTNQIELTGITAEYF